MPENNGLQDADPPDPVLGTTILGLLIAGSPIIADVKDRERHAARFLRPTELNWEDPVRTLEILDRLVELGLARETKLAQPDQTERRVWKLCGAVSE